MNISEESQAMMINCNTIHTFHGGSTQKYLTRNRLMLDPENDRNILACTGDEASQSVSSQSVFHRMAIIRHVDDLMTLLAVSDMI